MQEEAFLQSKTWKLNWKMNQKKERYLCSKKNYAGTVVWLVHRGDLLCDSVPVLESMCADWKRQFILERKCKMFSKYQPFRITACGCVVCRNCFSGIFSSQTAGSQYFYDYCGFDFSYDIHFGSSIITSDSEGLWIKTGKWTYDIMRARESTCLYDWQTTNWIMCWFCTWYSEGEKNGNYHKYRCNACKTENECDRTFGKSRHYNGKYFHTEKWKGKSNQSGHFKQDLPGIGLPAGRYFRIC